MRSTLRFTSLAVRAGARSSRPTVYRHAMTGSGPAYIRAPATLPPRPAGTDCLCVGKFWGVASEHAALVKPAGPVVGSARSGEACGTALTGRPQQRCRPVQRRAAKSRRRRNDAEATLHERLGGLPTRVLVV